MRQNPELTESKAAELGQKAYEGLLIVVSVIGDQDRVSHVSKNMYVNVEEH